MSNQDRRRRALEAMARQTRSPHEAAIARRKLEGLTVAELGDWRAAWARIEEHERIAAGLEAQQVDGEIDRIVRRWDNGTFRGLTFHIGADGAGLQPKRP